MAKGNGHDKPLATQIIVLSGDVMAKGNGHDKFAAVGAELVAELIKKIDAVDVIHKDERYVVAGMIKGLFPVFADKRGRLWAEHPKKFVKIFDPSWMFEEERE